MVKLHCSKDKIIKAIFLSSNCSVFYGNLPVLGSLQVLTPCGLNIKPGLFGALVMFRG